MSEIHLQELPPNIMVIGPGDLLFVFNVEPLWQPLFQGAVLMAAVCLGSLRLLRIRNRLELYG